MSEFFDESSEIRFEWHATGWLLVCNFHFKIPPYYSSVETKNGGGKVSWIKLNIDRVKLRSSSKLLIIFSHFVFLFCATVVDKSLLIRYKWDWDFGAELRNNLNPFQEISFWVSVDILMLKYANNNCIVHIALGILFFSRSFLFRGPSLHRVQSFGQILFFCSAHFKF